MNITQKEVECAISGLLCGLLQITKPSIVCKAIRNIAYMPDLEDTLEKCYRKSVLYVKAFEKEK